MTELFSVLVVNDEPQIRRLLRASLRSADLTVAEARNWEEAFEAIKKHAFDLALVDINIRGLNGLELCRQIRDLTQKMGLVVLTAGNDERDVVEVLEAGADDCITKPFRMTELSARCHALLRRIRAGRPDADVPLTAGDLELQLGSRLLRKAGKVVHLTPKEFDLLAFFMQNQGVPLTHAKLLRTIWGPDYGQELEYLRSYVKLLRKKIESDPARPQYLLTEPYLGYRFRGDSPSAA